MLTYSLKIYTQIAKLGDFRFGYEFEKLCFDEVRFSYGFAKLHSDKVGFSFKFETDTKTSNFKGQAIMDKHQISKAKIENMK